MGIVGFTFLLYPTIVTVGVIIIGIFACVYGLYKYVKEKCSCDTVLTIVCNCKECINCYDWCGRLFSHSTETNNSNESTVPAYTNGSIVEESSQIQLMERENTKAEQEQIKNLDKKPQNYYNRINSVIKSECSICTKLIAPNDIYLHFECGHNFHKNCGKEWVDKNPTCPNCREYVKFASSV